ncbi:MAG: hypothetical protein M5U34_43170 [Chloroflexi bacterium]|nr:hypothetical protein [Chloroflexota bacterium]
MSIVSQATGYRRIKRYTHETLGFGEIDLPEMTLETMGYWLIFGEAMTEELYDAGVLLRPNDYGANWRLQRKKKRWSAMGIAAACVALPEMI